MADSWNRRWFRQSGGLWKTGRCRPGCRLRFWCVSNYPFTDGNNRTGCVVARVFLADNGFRLQFDPADAVRTVEALAAENSAKKHWPRGLGKEL